MPFSPNSSPACALHADRLSSRNYPRNINYIPVVIFSYASILEKIAILGQPPRHQILPKHAEAKFFTGFSHVCGGVITLRIVTG